MADERELSDSEDEDGDNRRDQANYKNSNKRKASSDAVNGTTVTKVTETTVTTSKTEETPENGSTNEVQPSGSETVITTTTTTTEEVTKTTDVEGENDAPAPAEGVTDGMDTSE